MITVISYLMPGTLPVPNLRDFDFNYWEFDRKPVQDTNIGFSDVSCNWSFTPWVVFYFVCVLWGLDGFSLYYNIYSAQKLVDQDPGLFSQEKVSLRAEVPLVVWWSEANPNFDQILGMVGLSSPFLVRKMWMVDG
jgi:hypothetical protein